MAPPLKVKSLERAIEEFTDVQPSASMFKNYFVVAARNLKRQKIYSFITIAGFAVGLTCCYCIALYVYHELNYDRFHTKADRIYRMVVHTREHEKWGITTAAYGPDFERDLPGVEQMARVFPFSRSVYAEYQGNHYYLENLLQADAEVFDLFDFKLLKGDPKTALIDPRSIVISQEAATALFGAEDPIGKIIRGADMEFLVTGVLDRVPGTSSLQFDHLASFRRADAYKNPTYEAYNYFTFVLLNEHINVSTLRSGMDTFMKRHLPEWAEGYTLELQPLTAIHFQTDIRFDVSNTGSRGHIRAFLTIAVLILLIACANFTNLSTARAERRAREVGVRKVVGAFRYQLVVQFISESVLLAFLSVLIASVLTLYALPQFGKLVGRSLAVDEIDTTFFALTLVVIGLLAGLTAGMYPAYRLSAFRPVVVLKGNTSPKSGKMTLKQILMVGQFAISTALIAGALIVYNQVEYIRDKETGFQGDQVVSIAVTPELREGYDVFRTSLLNHHSIRSVCLTDAVPGGNHPFQLFQKPGSTSDEKINFSQVQSDVGYLETLGLELVAGRDFIRDSKPDAAGGYIVNETAVRALGIQNPIGYPFGYTREGQGRIIGVVKDYHFKSLHAPIEPLAIRLGTEWTNTILVRLAADHVDRTLTYLEQQFKTIAPHSYFQYAFLDDKFAELHEADTRFGQLIGFFALLAVCIASLGLFGLISFVTGQRTKEIGVRKVLGASVPGIVLLVSRSYLGLVAAGFVIAFPAAYLALDRWLNEFAYHIAIGPLVFVAAGGMALLIAAATVSYESIRAARTNPVNALRYE